mmetsp:Transcript_23771/g.71129  ORF Transcript_23771/g.71129 Transcript_23771/m.71129 type:complete len:346 (-) Transcript_23771:336-1373(-)
MGTTRDSAPQTHCAATLASLASRGWRPPAGRRLSRPPPAASTASRASSATDPSSALTDACSEARSSPAACLCSRDCDCRPDSARPTSPKRWPSSSAASSDCCSLASACRTLARHASTSSSARRSWLPYSSSELPISLARFEMAMNCSASRASTCCSVVLRASSASARRTWNSAISDCTAFAPAFRTSSSAASTDASLRPASACASRCLAVSSRSSCWYSATTRVASACASTSALSSSVARLRSRASSTQRRHLSAASRRNVSTSADKPRAHSSAPRECSSSSARVCVSSASWRSAPACSADRASLSGVISARSFAASLCTPSISASTRLERAPNARLILAISLLR